jgi:hypothetical protein
MQIKRILYIPSSHEFFPQFAFGDFSGVTSRRGDDAVKDRRDFPSTTMRFLPNTRA